MNLQSTNTNELNERISILRKTYERYQKEHLEQKEKKIHRMKIGPRT